jgi:DNA invertase Pin-like site-specific DNA recombinase
MNLTQIASADLKQVVALVEQKETLLAQVARIDAELTSIESGDTAAPTAPAKGKPGRKPGRPAKAKTGGRGGMKAAIIELLTAAGASGLSVQDIAAKLKAKPSNVHVWFSSTGKTVKEIKKLAPSKYGWSGTAAPVAAPAPAGKTEEPKAQKPAVRKVRARKSGGTKDAVIELVKGAGKAGITVKEIAAKLGVKTQGVYVWFGSTGKKVKEIKKVKPATYAWVGADVPF